LNAAYRRSAKVSIMRAVGVEEAGRSSVERTDEELCRGIAEGETAAFDQLVERYQARTFRMASAILANEADGRDISQEAFIRLYENAHRFDGRSRFSTWFHRILVNLCIDHQRRNRWWRKVIPLAGSRDESDAPPIDPPADDPGPELTAMRKQAAGRLHESLKELSPSQRAAVMLSVQEDLTSREIAAVLKCSEATARVHLHRGVARLMKMMKQA
jgi:RNA polymerase sigma-70 factor (ECF subfamily)